MPKLKCNFEGCNKKLSLIDTQMKCKCNGMYCELHRYASAHNCTYDWHAEKHSQLKKELLQEGNMMD